MGSKQIKKFKIYVLILMAVVMVSCSSDKKDQSEISIDFGSFKVRRSEASRINELGKIKRVVKLETKKQSLIGTINLVRIDGSSGDMLIGDFESARKVLRFDQNGRFIRSYGKEGEGPGEYISMHGFSMDAEGNIVIIGNFKLIKFSKDGELLKESRINFFANDLEIVGDSLYINVLRYPRGKAQNQPSILILNPFFVKIGGIARHDSRMQRYLYTIAKPLSQMNRQLFFLDNYDLKLNRYDTRHKELSALLLPNDNASLDSVWRKKSLSENDYREIRTSIHRFSDVYCIKDTVFTFEVCREKDIYNVWLINLVKKEALVFSLSSLYGDYDLKFQKDLFFDQIAGAYKDEVIGVFDNVEEFNHYKKDYPLLKDMEFNVEDNPILTFFEFHEVEIKAEQ